MTEISQLQIIPEPLAGSRLVGDYLQGSGAAASFFGGSPYSLVRFREKLEEVARRFGRAERETAALALSPTSDRARDRLARFVEEGGAMVTTGQQAGLFSGPLYTVYKALTLVRLAERLEQALGVVVVPVFWTASEDHDWEEASHTYLPVTGDGIRRVALPSDSTLPLPMSQRVLDSGVGTVLEDLAQAVAGMPFEHDVLKLARDSYRPGDTVSGAFATLVRELLSPFDVCLTDAGDPALKRASVAVLEDAIVEAARHEAVLGERTRQVVEGGYEGQVAVLDGATNVFFHGTEGRVRLYAKGEEVWVPETRERFPRDELVASLRTAPGRFSPNVFLRPIVESTVFPTLAYVAGPGEISYFAQVCALFPEFGIIPPVVFPRASFTLVEPPIARLLDKLGVDRADLARPRHELVEELARRSMPDSIRAALDRLGQAVTDGYRDLIDISAALDPTLEDALASLRNQALARVGDSERKVVRQLKRREEIAVAQLDRARASLRPEGEPQDRVLNVLPFLARHGRGILAEIAREISIDLE